MQQAILRELASAGYLPPAEDLDCVASEFGRSGREVVDVLAEQDFLCLDEDNAVRAAYPFSLIPTRHQVAITGGPTVWSMCAIDALGIGHMLRRAVTITSFDPLSGETIRVELGPAAARWNPTSALVFAGAHAEGGPAATGCCDTINFFTSGHAAARWAALHAAVVELALGQVEATELGRTIFGALLTRNSRHTSGGSAEFGAQPDQVQADGELEGTLRELLDAWATARWVLERREMPGILDDRDGRPRSR